MMKYIHIYFNSIIRRESREEKLENQYDGRSKILWPMSQNVYWFIGIGHLSRHRQTHWIRDGLEGQLHPKSWHCQNWVDPGLEEELWDNLYEILQEWGVLWHFKLDYNGTKMFQPFFCWWWWGSLSSAYNKMQIIIKSYFPDLSKGNSKLMTKIRPWKWKLNPFPFREYFLIVVKSHMSLLKRIGLRKWTIQIDLYPCVDFEI